MPSKLDIEQLPTSVAAVLARLRLIRSLVGILPGHSQEPTGQSPQMATGERIREAALDNKPALPARITMSFQVVYHLCFVQFWWVASSVLRRVRSGNAPAHFQNYKPRKRAERGSAKAPLRPKSRVKNQPVPFAQSHTCPHPGKTGSSSRCLAALGRASSE